MELKRPRYRESISPT